MATTAPIEIQRDLRSWSIARWTLIVLVVASLHAALVFLSARTTPQPHPVFAAPAHFQLLAGTAVEPALSQMLAFEDPAIFAEPHPRGFSGLAWIQPPQPRISITSKIEAPMYLAYNERPVFAPTTALSSETSSLEDLQPELRLPTLPPERHVSRLELFIAPGGRRLISAALPPIQAHTDVLSNTVVQAEVDRHGRVISARVIGRSGSRKADDDALAITNDARFQPVAPNPLDRRPSSPDWATLNFQWFTVEPSAPAPATPPPR